MISRAASNSLEVCSTLGTALVLLGLTHLCIAVPLIDQQRLSPLEILVVVLDLPRGLRLW